MQVRKRNRVYFTCCAALLGAIGCYHLDNLRTVLSGAPTWTGAGHSSVASTYFGGWAIGLAGEDIHAFQGTSHSVWDSPLSGWLGSGYTLTGIAQTHALGHHENTFVHAYPASNRDALELYRTTGFHFNSFQQVQPSFPAFIDDGVVYEVTRICDMAATAIPEFGHPYDDDSHLFLSVIACRLDSPSSCAGGVVEADFSPSDEWWVKVLDGWQSTIRKPNGARFSAECMPISVTGLGGTNDHSLAVGDPSMDEISVFQVGALDSPPVSSKRNSRSEVIRDLVLEGQGSGATDFSFVSVLWGGGAGTTVEHTLAVNGELNSSPFLVEPVSSSTRFIHTTGAGGAPAGDQADLFTFGPSVVQRTYKKD